MRCARQAQVVEPGDVRIVLECQRRIQSGELCGVEHVVQLQLYSRLNLLTEYCNRKATLECEVPVPETRVAEDSQRYVAEVADSRAERLRHRECARIEMELILFRKVRIARHVEHALAGVDAGGRRLRRRQRRARRQRRV